MSGAPARLSPRSRLVFDNTAGRLPVDYHEVAIKRRVERDGESDYFLNGTRVRRRDLLHLLSSTGLTVDSYAIIDQHDIEHIVVCTPGERRQLLEEAAQVRGVKARRQEAVQRMTELIANLLRLEDLRSEIEPRLEVAARPGRRPRARQPKRWSVSSCSEAASYGRNGANRATLTGAPRPRPSRWSGG